MQQPSKISICYCAIPHPVKVGGGRFSCHVNYDQNKTQHYRALPSTKGHFNWAVAGDNNFTF
jgi:hypothetical protein